MSSGKKQITGYRYSFGIHMGLSRGPVNVIKEVRVGDLTAWTGAVTDNAEVNINKPSLFGGDTKEGGIVGTLTMLFGGAAQTVSSSIKSLMGGFVPDFRGVTTLFYRGQISSNNPYPKAWDFRIARWTAGWDLDSDDPDRAAPWYAPKARILLADGQVEAMNGAHIIYECYTNREWGRGYHPSLLHDASFTAAANTLCSEMFGLCFLWSRQGDVEEFINMVLSHIGGVVYPDPETGKIALKLIRGDYDPASLPVFSYDSGILEASEDETGGEDSSFSEIIVKYTDPLVKGEASVIEQNAALMQANGEIKSTTATYAGIPTAELAHRVARRDLDMQLATRRFKLVMDRRAWKLTVGTPFKVSLPDRGVSEMIVRVGEYSESAHTDGRITLKVVEDYFGLPATGYSGTVESAWAPPDLSALAATSRVEEATYRDLAATMSAADRAAMSADATYLSVLAVKPSGTAIYYDLATAATGEAITIRGSGDWTPVAPLAAPVGAYDTVLSFGADADISAAQAGEALLLGDEILGVVSVDDTTKEITVKRGCVDTIPEAHAIGVDAWFYDGLVGSDLRDYASGETVEVRVLTATGSQRLDIADAPPVSATLSGRQGRPYPPGNLAVNGDPFAALAAPAYAGEIALTWSHRDRLLQDDALVGHGEASVGPEAGTTYNVRFYDDATLVRSATGVSAAGWTYTSVMLAADGEPAATGWWVEVESERGGLVSLRKYRFFVPRRAAVSVAGATGAINISGIAGSSSPRAVRVTGIAGALIVES